METKSFKARTAGIETRTVRYVIITPAHNEAAFIEKTIESVIAQTVRPLKWVVVSDGSTDRTAEIVATYQTHHPFIELLNLERPPGRHFGNKVNAFNQGMMQIEDVNYEFIGNLDADISFDERYFENILRRFDGDNHLGIAGGMVHSSCDGEFISQQVSADSVAGAVQMFRRACFEQIGGYLALPHGGIDAAAEITARMMGWRVHTFPDHPVLEHRWTGSATSRPLAARIKMGRRFHSLGYGLGFYCLRCAYRAMSRPRIAGSIAEIYGFLTSHLRREPIVLSSDVVRFLRREQREKVLQILKLSQGHSRKSQG